MGEGVCAASARVIFFLLIQSSCHSSLSSRKGVGMLMQRHSSVSMMQHPTAREGGGALMQCHGPFDACRCLYLKNVVSTIHMN